MDALVECYNICSPIELKDKVVNILNSMHITQMLRIEDRRIVDYQRRIPILIRDENFNGNVYQYIEANNNVFVEVVDKCYTDLSSQEVKHSCSLKKYKHKLTTIKKMYGGSLPDWAKAIDLDESYSIKIA